MDFAKVTERARGFIQAAQSFALSSSHQYFTPEHLLKILLDDEEGLASSLIQAAKGRPQEAKQAVNITLSKLPKVQGGTGQIYLASETAKVFDLAQELSKKAGDSFVTAERLLQALAMSTGTGAASILKNAGVTPTALNAAINDLRKGRTADSATAENAYDALKKYARDL